MNPREKPGRTSDYRVDVFFYGSYMNFSVLKEAGVGERPCETARMPVPALCYLSHDMENAAPNAAYIGRIPGSAREYGFPEAYLKHIESLER